MMEIILAGVVSLVITLAAGKLLIPALIRLKAGQSIKEVGPTWHKGKQGTPTMGGLMFIIGIGIAILILGWKGMLEGNFTHLYVYVFALVFGVIGYIDDYQKVKHHQNTGLTAPQKFLLQLAAAVAFLCLMRYEGMLSPNLYIPFFNTHLVLPWVVYMIFAAFVIIGTVNAVNITDGVDGLSSSVTLPVAAFFAAAVVLRATAGSGAKKCCQKTAGHQISHVYHVAVFTIDCRCNGILPYLPVGRNPVSIPIRQYFSVVRSGVICSGPGSFRDADRRSAGRKRGSCNTSCASLRRRLRAVRPPCRESA